MGLVADTPRFSFNNKQKLLMLVFLLLALAVVYPRSNTQTKEIIRTVVVTATPTEGPTPYPTASIDWESLDDSCNGLDDFETCGPGYTCIQECSEKPLYFCASQDQVEYRQTHPCQ